MLQLPLEGFSSPFLKATKFIIGTINAFHSSGGSLFLFDCVSLWGKKQKNYSICVELSNSSISLKN
jgi:hypothetical protein